MKPAAPLDVSYRITDRPGEGWRLTWGEASLDLLRPKVSPAGEVCATVEVRFRGDLVYRDEKVNLASASHRDRLRKAVSAQLPDEAPPGTHHFDG